MCMFEYVIQSLWVCVGLCKSVCVRVCVSVCMHQCMLLCRCVCLCMSVCFCVYALGHAHSLSSLSLLLYRQSVYQLLRRKNVTFGLFSSFFFWNSCSSVLQSRLAKENGQLSESGFLVIFFSKNFKESITPLPSAPLPFKRSIFDWNELFPLSIYIK